MIKIIISISLDKKEVVYKINGNLEPGEYENLVMTMSRIKKAVSQGAKIFVTMDVEINGSIVNIKTSGEEVSGEIRNTYVSLLNKLLKEI